MQIKFIICFSILINLQACISKPQRIIRNNFNHEKTELIIGAFYSGTQNQTTIHFFKDYRFYVHCTGIYFYNEWSSGNWSRNNDTLNLVYDTDSGIKIGNQVIVKSKHLLIKKRLNDTLRFYPIFTIMFPKMGKKIKFDDY